MALDHAALAAEIAGDPTQLGYAGKEDGEIADLLNAPRAGVTIRRASIPSKEIWEAIRYADMTALPANPSAAQLSAERRALAWLTGLPGIPSVRVLNADGTNGPVALNLLDIFPDGSGTRARLIALASRVGSRAEALFGEGQVVSHLDVAVALGRRGIS